MDDYSINVLGKDNPNKLTFLNDDGGSPSKRIKSIRNLRNRFYREVEPIYYEFQIANNDKNKVISITEGGNITVVVFK